MKKIDWKSIFVKKVLMIIFDVLAVNIAYFIAQYSYDGCINEALMPFFLHRMIPVTLIFVVLLYAFRIYSSMWEYAGVRELINVVCALGIGGLSSIAVDIILMKFDPACKGLSVSGMAFYLSGTLLAMVFVAGMRLLYRIIRRRIRMGKFEKLKKFERVMVVGAGDMGMIIISELEANSYRKGKPIVAVDDNPQKIGKRMRGIPVAGNCDSIPEIAKKYKIDTIIYCIPSADTERSTEILRIAVETGCKVKTAPSLLEMRDGKEAGQIRDVNISDLLARPEVKLDKEVCRYVNDQVILVTGGGGSIGSEICRQVAHYNPKKIIIFDIYENNAFMLRNQLEATYHGDPAVYVRIGSVRDEKRLTEVFEEFHPTIVFHAAAHKHVPLMEDCPKEAVKNNIFGTYNVAKTAIEYGVKRFVSISTDKAVNPANVMGATKRVTEMVVQYFQRKCGGSTMFAAVRFGNVLGSSGSVIPIFTEQIKAGGPVTVTHKDITRYFMTIPEASQLVVQAGGLANGGEIFVLDMGEPVKILSLAENLIRLSGFKPYTEINIEFSGLRPGEKLYEELALEEESDQRKRTANNKIFVTKPVAMDDEKFEKQLEELKSASPEEVRGLLKKVVPNFVEQKI